MASIRAASAFLLFTAFAAVLLAPRGADAAISCSQVVNYIGSCLNYARNGGALPPACCNGIRGLNAAAQSTPDRQATCTCLKSIAGLVNPGLASGLPGKCGVNVPYPISSSVGCSRIH